MDVVGDVALCLRPRSIEIGHSAGGIPARVLKIRLLGSEALIELGVKGLDKPLVVRADSTDIPAKGVEVTIGVNTESVLIFPAGGSTS